MPVVAGAVVVVVSRSIVAVGVAVVVAYAVNAVLVVVGVVVWCMVVNEVAIVRFWLLIRRYVRGCVFGVVFVVVVAAMV